MFTMLDVITGLAFTYLLLALICTAISEWISTLGSFRARNLVDALDRLLDPTGNGKGEAARALLRRPELLALSRSEKHPPSYIPRDSFVRAVMEARPENAAAKAPAVNASPEELERHAEEWGRQFDATMERATGWYRRRMQTVTVLVAVGITLVANADTARMADRLWRSPMLRAQVVAAAKQRAAGERPAESTAYPDLDRPASDDSASGGTAEVEGVETATVSEQERELLEGVMGWREDFARVNQRLCDSLMVRRDRVCGAPNREAECESLLAGIERDDRVRVDGALLVPTDAWPGQGPFWWALFGVAVSRVLGWLLTIAAISLGAPFWFDTLIRFVNIRGAGDPPLARNKEEAAR